MNGIVAQAINGVIGRDGGLPWHLPTDLAFFKKMTLGKTVVMGRKTYESIGRPLPQRRNIVLTRDAAWRAPAGVEVVRDLDQILAIQERDQLFVIGGASIYHALANEISTLYLTLVEALVAGDTFAPRWEGEWRAELLESHQTPPPRPRRPWYPHRIYRMTRIRPPA